MITIRIEPNERSVSRGAADNQSSSSHSLTTYQKMKKTSKVSDRVSRRKRGMLSPLSVITAAIILLDVASSSSSSSSMSATSQQSLSRSVELGLQHSDDGRLLQDVLSDTTLISPSTSSTLQASQQKLSTVFAGTIESTRGVEFKVENTNSERHLLLSGLGLNVKTSTTAADDDDDDSTTGSTEECRVKVYTKLVDLEAAIGNNYQLALDTNEVQCHGENEETVIPAKLFLKYHREMYACTGARVLETVDHEEEVNERKMMRGGGDIANGRRVQTESSPLLIPPNSMMSLYIIVLRKTSGGVGTNENFIQDETVFPKLLTSPGCDFRPPIPSLSPCILTSYPLYRTVLFQQQHLSPQPSTHPTPI